MATKSPYSVHPGVAMAREWIGGLKARTGRTLEQWIALVRKSGPPGEKARREWLKSTQGLGSNAASHIAERSVGKGQDLDDPKAYLEMADEYVSKMFAGGKAGLKPLYDALLALGLSVGKDVRACPCQTIVPFYRNHVFAQIKPSTRTRIDFGLALGDTKAPERLIDTGGFAKKDRITHRIEITRLSDIDAEVRKWLKTAYERDA